MPQQQFDIPQEVYHQSSMSEVFEQNDDMIQDVEIVEEITENIAGNNPSKKVCNVCGKPAFCQSKDGKIFLCEKHYIQLMNEQKKKERHTPIVRQEAKIGRNDICPCGSGKKYKKCCMNKEE